MLSFCQTVCGEFLGLFLDHFSSTLERSSSQSIPRVCVNRKIVVTNMLGHRATAVDVVFETFFPLILLPPAWLLSSKPIPRVTSKHCSMQQATLALLYSGWGRTPQCDRRHKISACHLSLEPPGLYRHSERPG